MDDDGSPAVRKAIDTLRRCVWKGGVRGLGAAVSALVDPMEGLYEGWQDLASAHGAWEGDKCADTRDALEQALNTFDDACRAVFGPTEWEVALGVS